MACVAGLIPHRALEIVLELLFKVAECVYAHFSSSLSKVVKARFSLSDCLLSYFFMSCLPAVLVLGAVVSDSRLPTWCGVVVVLEGFL